MDHLAFLDRILLDSLAFCDNEPGSFDWIGTQRGNIEYDPDLTAEERRDALLSLRVAQVIDLAKRDEVEEIREDVFRIRYPGCCQASISLIDHDRLGASFWESLDLRDDMGEACWVYYYDQSDDATVHMAGNMKAEEKDTANFLLSARVEACLNHLDKEMAA